MTTVLHIALFVVILGRYSAFSDHKEQIVIKNYFTCFTLLQSMNNQHSISKYNWLIFKHERRFGNHNESTL